METGNPQRRPSLAIYNTLNCCYQQEHTPPTKSAGAIVDAFSKINDPRLPAATTTKELLTLSQNGVAATKPNNVA
ncbi:hypothetical protein F511_47707 [Dorcoceras hygrometricum]|uniref:Uncharacterized protein n=1 Tax=Dorcoceras hygrometricum TaxID=472368 RepID=A0A2Z6ZWK4_9LAMI|nr:hypothetical protein F511_47707 [Dorcoceras hygrometricum]